VTARRSRATLEEVVANYDRGGNRNPRLDAENCDERELLIGREPERSQLRGVTGAETVTGPLRN